MEIIKRKHSYYLSLLLVILFLAGCNQDSNLEETQFNEITGQAIAAEILRACKYPDGEFCSETCCISDKMCDEGAAYMECDLKTGEWLDNTYADPACASECEIAKPAEETEEAKENKTLQLCLEGWKCFNKFERIYRYSNCSFGKIERCSTNCVNDTCAKLCTPNTFSCKNDILRKCDEDGSDWRYYMACDYECKNNTCAAAASLNQTTNQTQNETQQQNICDNTCFSITDFHYDASGNDCNNLNDEYVTFKNSCTFSCDLTGWTISDASIHTYTFPSFGLGSSSSFTLYSGNGTNTATRLYWDSKYTPCKAIWNNDGDTLYLKNSNNDFILNYTYS